MEGGAWVLSGVTHSLEATVFPKSVQTGRLQCSSGLRRRATFTTSVLPRSRCLPSTSCALECLSLHSSGQLPSSEDEPAPKKQKLSASAKKEDIKPKYDSSPPDPLPNSADEGPAETLPENALEPEPESAPRADLERRHLPGPPGEGRPEPSLLEDLSPCPASCGGGVVTTVTVSGRDPRTALSGSCMATASTTVHLDSTHTVEARPDMLKPALTSVTVPKSILAKPSSSPDPRYLSLPPSPNTRCSS